ncbi:MAG: amidohydrolase family protein, partial [Verrucomicrobiales bacterium]
MIWDLHCHLPAFRGATPEECVDRMIEIGGRLGIERFCVYMGMKWERDPDPGSFRRQNDEILRALNHRPDRILGFVYLNPRHLAESLDEIERCVADGPMVGLKLWVAHRCSRPELDPIVERATALNAVVFQHTWSKVTGNLPGESTPSDLAILAKRHPEARLICGHTGGDWEGGIRAIRTSPNVSIGIGGFDPTAGITETALRELGSGRIIFGSDAGGRSFASQLGKVYGGDMLEEAAAQALGGNLKLLLTPILQSK